MKSIKILLFFLLSLTIFSSCATKTKQALNCQKKFEEIKTLSSSPKNYYIKGGIFVKGIFLKFSGKVGEKTKLDFYPPFGGKLFSLSYDKDNICIKHSKQVICSPNLYLEYLDVEIPFDLKNLLTASPTIPEEAKYGCDGKHLIVSLPETRFIYKIYKKPQLERILYKHYTADYIYENGKLKKIIVKDAGKKVFKIYIKQIKKL